MTGDPRGESWVASWLAQGGKPWPLDVVLIISPTVDEADPKNPERTTTRHCRDCQCELVVCLRSMDDAASLPTRYGRAIEYLCTPCALEYERPEIVYR